jgi:hypothetical protein
VFATLYRYPHPYDATKFIYCGQAVKPERRDRQHRSGKSPFGRRFQRAFPGVELPQPVKEVVEVQGHLELNELETIWMFQYHTWRGYGGMNLMFPGSDDYKNMGTIGGPIGGRKNVESGQFARMRELPQSKEAQRRRGRQTVESGQLAQMRELPQTKEAQRRVGRTQGPIQGRKNAENGHLVRIGSIGGRTTKKNGAGFFAPGMAAKGARSQPRTAKVAGGKAAGRWAVESGHLARIRELPHVKEAYKRNSPIASCARWNIRRGKPCTCGTHGEQKIAA